MSLRRDGFEPSGSKVPRPLILVLHGMRGSRKSVASVVDAAKRKHPDADLLVPIMQHGYWVSFYPLSKTVGDLQILLNRYWREQYTELVVIGHSTGGPLARALYLAGARTEAAWAQAMAERGRIIMLAGMNRGWQISHHLSIKHAALWSVGALAGHLIALFGPTVALFDLRRGSPFLTRIRFEWLALAQRTRMPLVVQLLGTIDDMVGPEDAIDLVTGANFRYLDVPFSGHLTVLDMDPASEHGRARSRVLETALGEEARIEVEEVRPWALSQSGEDEVRRAAVNHVVFVIHGIRDRGFWTDKIARHIWRRCPAEQRKGLERVTSSYGYFGMGPFLLPWIRRKKVEWLADQVLETKARFPNARFSYVGHSNGTYLLAKALENYRDIEGFQFDRVVFAGSVVRKNYDWSVGKRNNQMPEILNIVATTDWVVALFPQLFELVPIQDLGSAGHNGFTKIDAQQNFKYARGGHGAGLDETHWDMIADFILGSKNITLNNSTTIQLSRTGGWLRRLGMLTPLPALLLLMPLALVLIPYSIVAGWRYLASSELAIVIFGGGVCAAAALAFGFAIYYAFKAAGPRGVLATVTVPALFITVVWLAARWVGLELPEPASWGPAVVALYFFGLMALLRQV